MSYQERKREVWLDITKGFAICMVVLAYSIQRTSACIDLSGSVAYFGDTIIHLFQMPLFFFVAGYLYEKSNRKTSDISTKEYIIKRFVKLGIPYCIFTIAVWVVKFFFSFLAINSVGVKDLLLALVEPISFLWFLYILLFVQISICLIDRFSKRNDYVLMLISFVLWGCYIFSTSNSVWLTRYCLYFAFYFIGMLCYRYSGVLMSKYACTIHIMLGVLLTIVYMRNVESKILYLFCSVSVSLFIFTFIFLIRKDAVYFKYASRMLSCLGSISLYIYLLHPLVINVVKVLLTKIGIVNAYFWIIVMWLIGLTVPCIYALIAKQIWILDLPFNPARLSERKKYS